MRSVLHLLTLAVLAFGLVVHTVAAAPAVPDGRCANRVVASQPVQPMLASEPAGLAQPASLPTPGCKSPWLIVSVDVVAGSADVPLERVTASPHPSWMPGRMLRPPIFLRV